MGFPTSVVLMAAAILGNHSTDGPLFIHNSPNLLSNYTGETTPAIIAHENGTGSLQGLRGRETFPSTGKNIAEKIAKDKMALKGRTLRVVTLKDWPMSDFKINKTNNKTYGIGIAFHFMEMLQNEFGFDYVMVTPEDNTTNGVIQTVIKGADMAAAFLPIIFLPGLSFSKRLAMENWVVLLRRPQESASGSSLLAPFDTRVWILILLSVSIVGPVIYTIMVVRVRLCRGSARLSKVFSLTSCVWFVYGALMRQGSTLNPISDSSRLLFATWWIFITVVTAFYTANLTAFLTLSRFTLPIDGPLDIVRKSYSWIGHSGSPFEVMVQLDENFNYLRKSIGKGLGKFVNSSDEDLMELVRNEGLMFIREKRVVDRLLYKDYLKKIEDGVEEAQRCTFAVTPEPFLSIPLGFVFPENSMLRILFTSKLTSLVEAGIVDHLMNADLPKSEICPLNLGNKERQLRNSDLMTTYKAVCIGLLVAAVAFLGERALWRCLRWKNTKAKHLLKVNSVGIPFERMAMNAVFARKWMMAAKNHKHSIPRKKDDLGNTSMKVTSRQDYGDNFSREVNIFNGREYLQVYENMVDGRGIRKLIPIRAPSAVLFDEGRRNQYSKRKHWKDVLNVI
ncbi:glutamate receptor ionotropic, delta-1 isoform X2 [Ischnura elegans]|uniref:glutamate receptor ionotropic, delta-1 isoform X2 n=1 Tax=Ischnura elegans TaxID=197161 RepID=UPI001ED8B1C7|nr:glutamate receptor ionotropic, delta-1 isoform X2 [Ischnura elegans]